MDTSNWRPTQGTEPTMDTSDWRSQLKPDSRQRIVNKIMDTLKRHLPVTGLELRKIAQRFEEKTYTAATSQSDYLRKISLKLLTMENKSQNTMVNPMQSNPGGPSNKPIDSGISMQSQVHNPAQSHAVPLPNQPQSRQQLLSQNIQNNIAPPVSNIGQTPIQNVVGPNSNMQNNMFGGPQRQMPARQQVVPQQQQQQFQNSQQYLYQQQFMKHKPQLGNIQHPLMQFMKHKPQLGNIPHPLMQSHIQLQPQQQQQQPNLQQPNQLQSSQQSVMQNSSVMQPSIVQTSSLSSLQQNQQSNNAQQSSQPMLQQHPQTVMRQQQQQPSIINQQQTSITQQSILTPQQQQQQLLAKQSNVTNIQHPQLLGQQLLAAKSGNSGMQRSQHSGLMPQQSKVPMQQQSQQNVSNLLPSQGLQSQQQAPQQQLMPQMQSQPAQLQQQLGLQQQQQPNSLHRDMQQRFQASGSLLQQQKQLYQSQRALPDSSSTSLDSTAQTGQPSGDDWQEEVYQKIKQMKESYLPELREMYQKIATKLQQHDSLPQQPKSDQLDKLKMFKTMLERIIAFLQVSKVNILPNFKEKIGAYEKQIINFISTNRPRKNMSSLQPGQLPPPHMHSISQPQSQLTQVQPHENQMNSQLQSTNLQNSIGTMQQNNMASLQHNSIPSMTGLSTAQQNMMNSIQPSSNIYSGQGNGMNSLQQGSNMLQHQQRKQQQEQMLQNLFLLLILSQFFTFLSILLFFINFF